MEAALRDLARHQERSEQGGFVHRVGQRVVSIVLNSAAVERLAAAARPLIARLNNEQKQAAGQLAQEMGLGAVVMAALNWPPGTFLRRPFFSLTAAAPDAGIGHHAGSSV